MNITSKLYIKNKNTDNLYSDAKAIVNTLASTELDYIGGKYIDSPNIFYRKIYYDDNVPIAFSDLYRFKDSPTYLFFVFAIKASHRGKGLSDIMVKDALEFSKFTKCDIIWRCDKKNRKSLNLAIKYGLKLIGSDERHYKFSTNLYNTDDVVNESVSLNPSKIKVETISDINNTVYRDKYQVIADNVVSENTKANSNEPLWVTGSSGDGKSYITEGLLTRTVTLYHGSLTDINGTIKPRGLDLGNSKHGPGWSTFCWNKKEYAYMWAVYQAAKFQYIQKCRDIEGTELPQITKDMKIAINKPTLDAVLTTLPCKAYVYEFSVDSSEVYTGHTGSIKEYTIRNDIDDYKKTEITVTRDVLMSYIHIVDDMDVYKDSMWYGRHWTFNRNIFDAMINTHDQMMNDDICKFIYKAIRSGDFAIGDDIGEFLKANSKEIHTITPLQRINIWLKNTNINPITITESYSGNLPMISDEWLNKYADKVNRLKNATNSECYMRLSFTDNLTPYQKLMPIERRFKFPDISNLIREDTYLAGDFHFTKYDDAHDVSNIKRINALPKNATLIVLGDVGYMKNLDPNQKDIIRDYFSMCTFENMYLVLGNHDVYPVDFYLSLGFKGVYENITVPNKKWILSHQAMDGISDKYINFHAHNHGTYKYSSYLRKIDNKIDCWEGFCPNKFKTIREWILFDKASHFKKVFKDE